MQEWVTACALFSSALACATGEETHHTFCSTSDDFIVKSCVTKAFKLPASIGNRRLSVAPLPLSAKGVACDSGKQMSACLRFIPAFRSSAALLYDSAFG